VVFAYQAFAGVEYALNRNMSLGLEYHFFGTTAMNRGPGRKGVNAPRQRFRHAWKNLPIFPLHQL
jgi:opacity protein-like surface antigen